jgi:pimeloyl-ACP methyl ester carboxylesterase
MLKSILLWTATALLLTAVVVVALFARDMRRAYAQIEGRSRVVESPFGVIEYTDRGRGLPVLVIHGSGGGFDQGELLARAALGDEAERAFRLITPSRFGYLRSTFQPGATFDEQAHAYAHLLDQLGEQRVAVVAFSHGGPSALLFAVLHPQRVSSLTLISAGVAASSAPEQAQADAQGRALMMIFQHDALYWGLTKAWRTRFLQIMGVSAEVTRTLTPAQRALADALIDGMNPVAPRAAGAAFDNRAAMPNQRIAGVAAPTLILHARDDSLQRFANATYAAATVPQATLHAFDRGGHLLLAVEQPAVMALVRAHVQRHAAGLPSARDSARRP